MKTRCFLLMLMLAAMQVSYSQNYVQNGNFAETTTDEVTGLVLPAGWDLEGNAFLNDERILNLVTSWLPDGAAEGTRVLDLWRGTDDPYQIKLTQTVTGLPDGIYSLSATAALGGENVFSLYAKVADTEETTPMPESGDYERKEMNSIQIAGGKAIVGFTANSTSSSNWFDITDFELVKTGNLTSINKLRPSGVSVAVTGNLITVASDEPVLSVKLYSIDGKMLYSNHSPEGEISIFTAPQQKGVCILHIEQTSGTETGKIIIR
ncbi:MAG: T9SS type A sorting domain-containing protein [Dysgonamonadaceae bacterium]|jgi:hypothetical protein|nr:T9SS type A sorting domain-containing protein [Dysgonamonadaceae bacterium]